MEVSMKIMTFGMWHHTGWQKCTFDLEEPTVSIFNISNFQQITQYHIPEDSNLYCCSEIYLKVNVEH